MLKLKKVFPYLFVSIVTLFLVSAAIAESPKEVTVVNDQSHPVPITGTVSGTVAITGTPNVNVVKTLEPLHRRASCSILLNAETCSWLIYEVPAGKRLVIEYFSCSSRVQSGESLSCHIDLLQPGQMVAIVNQYLPSLPAASVPNQRVSAGQNMKLIVDPEIQVGVGVDRAGNDEQRGVGFAISGYLEDAP